MRNLVWEKVEAKNGQTHASRELTILPSRRRASADRRAANAARQPNGSI